jgi:hypothetical protein
MNFTLIHAQKTFSNFSRVFKEIKLPIVDLKDLHYGENDTLNPFNVNNWYWDSQETIPRTRHGKTIYVHIPPRVWQKGNLIDQSDFSRIPDSPSTMEDHGILKIVKPKVYAVGQLQLNPNYALLITKVEGLEIAYYEIISFTKDGKRLSGVLLFMYHKKSIFEDVPELIITKSSIHKDGLVEWENQDRGLTVKRQYKFRDDGYFEILNEESSGKYEY